VICGGLIVPSVLLSNKLRELICYYVIKLIMSKYISIIILWTTGSSILQTNMWVERTNIDVIVLIAVGLCSLGGAYWCFGGMYCCICYGLSKVNVSYVSRLKGKSVGDGKENEPSLGIMWGYKYPFQVHTISITEWPWKRGEKGNDLVKNCVKNYSSCINDHRYYTKQIA
jgi:hypothetical protein